MKHTPGHFLAVKGVDDEPERWVVVVDGPRQWLVATIENGAPGDTLKTEGANAHLFAAAPNLLDSCRELLGIVRLQNGNLHADVNEIQARAMAAIAKADPS